MDSFKNDDGRRLDGLGDVCALVQGEVIGWDLAVLPRNQLVQLFKSQVEVEGRGVIKVVVGSIVVLVIPIQQILLQKTETSILT